MPNGPVLHLVPCFGCGGREQVVIDTIYAMRESRPGLVGTFGGPGVAHLEAHGIPWLPVPLFPSTPANIVRSFFALRRLVRTHHIGFIHSHHRYSGLVGRLVAAAAGIPFVSTVHDLARGQRRVTRFAVGSTVMVFSDAVERHVVEYFGVPKSSVHRVPMGIALNTASSRDASERQVVAFFGRLEWEKGPDLFLEAGARILRARPDAELWIAGTGDLEDSMRQLGVRLGLGASVRFLGWLTDVPAAIRAASVVMVPSRREGFGRTVLEAMMLGKPVVATRVGGIPELIDDGCTGRLVSAEDVAALADATVSLLQDPAMAGRLGAAAGASTHHRGSMAAMVAAVEDVYRRVARA